MTPALLGAGLGFAAAAGLLLAVRHSPPLRRPRLDDRLAPYLRDTPRPSRLLAQARFLTPSPTAERLLGPLLAVLAGYVGRVLGGSRSLRRRLEQAGRDMTVEQFRAEQVIWGVLGLLVGLLLAGVDALVGWSTNSLAFVFLAVALALGGGLGRDRWLSHEVRVREERMLAEFPTVAEMLALAVSAGEGAVGALERVTRVAGGELAAELRRALGDARTGVPLVDALEGLAARTSLPALARFVDGVAIALERGTPLADVLRAQAIDVRETGRRALLEAGGRKEIAMLIPVVFLILPVTILFALFPGNIVLSPTHPL